MGNGRFVPLPQCLSGTCHWKTMYLVIVFFFKFALSFADGLTVFCNLAEDESLFGGKGDYQFDVYRLMKKATRYVLMF